MTNISSRSAVKSSNRYCFGICAAYGDWRYGTSRLRLCWKISIVVPSLSTTSAPFVPAADSERERGGTSALAPRARVRRGGGRGGAPGAGRAVVGEGASAGAAVD